MLITIDPLTQDFLYKNKEFEDTKKLRNGKYRNYYCCPFTNIKYESPIHSKDIKPRYMKVKEKGKRKASLDKSSISIKINDTNLLSPFTSKNNNLGYNENASITEDKTSAMFKLSTITNLNPQEMRKINYNPYKKRENQLADPQVLSYLKEISQKESNVVRKNEKFTGRFLDKLRKKREVDFKSSNQLNTLSSNALNGGKAESSNNLLHEKYEIESELKNNPIDYFKTYRNPNLKKTTDDKVFIDNNEYPKTNLNDISKKVLEKCKFTHKKSKNANTSLKVGEGKLMITNGMTVSEFSKNYHLNA